MTAKFSASADGTKVYLGNASEYALELDATGKLIKAVAPYKFSGERVYAPGDILQVVTHFDGGTPSSGGSWANLTIAAANITPKSNNSRFIIECCATLYVGNIAAVNAAAVFQMFSGSPPAGTFGTYQTISAFSASGGIGVRCGGSFLGVVQNTDLVAKSFALAGSPTVGVPNEIAATQQGWKITEIQN